MGGSVKTAVIVRASSEIGEALARQLHQEDWRLGLLARRETLLAMPGGTDLVVISAGTGHVNPQHDIVQDRTVQQQEAVTLIRARELLVRLRTAAINAVRGLTKACGRRMPTSSTKCFAQRGQADIHNESLIVSGETA